MKPIEPNKWQGRLLKNQDVAPRKKIRSPLSDTGNFLMAIFLIFALAFFGWHFWQWSKRDFRVFGLDEARDAQRIHDLQPQDGRKWGQPRQLQEDK